MRVAPDAGGPCIVGPAAAGHPQGVALLYTDGSAGGTGLAYIVGPPLAGGLRRAGSQRLALLYTDGSAGGTGLAYIVGPPLAGGLRRGWPAWPSRVAPDAGGLPAA